MSYMIQKFHDEAAADTCANTGILGANLPQAAATVRTLEVWRSSFNDPGDDWCEYRALDRDGKLIARRRTEGYFPARLHRKVFQFFARHHY
jgi:hypothetical protein